MGLVNVWVTVFLGWLALGVTASWAQGDDSAPTANATTAPKDSLAIDLPSKSVKGHANQVHQSGEIGRVRLSREDLARTTATQGDPLRAVSTLPGVNSQNDLSVRPFIRGGKAEETRIFLDGILLLQPYHFGGAYSPFNPELVERLDVYRSGTSATMRDALSGAVAVKTRKPEKFEAIGDVSLLRANAVAAFPLPGKVVGYFGFHTYYYDQVFKGGLAALDLFVDNSDFEKYSDDAAAYLDLPSFRDFQAGLFWNPIQTITLHWNSIFSSDQFRYYQPTWKYYSGKQEISPRYYDWATFYRPDGLRKEIGPDTLANIALTNGVHYLQGEWKASSRLKVKGDFAYQKQAWDIAFLENRQWTEDMNTQGDFQGQMVRAPSEYQLSLRRDVFQLGLQAEWAIGEKHLLTFGVQREARIENYDSRIPRPIYEVLIKGNSDLLESLGFYGVEGATFRRSSIGDFIWRVNPLDLAKRIRFDYQGRQTPAYGSFFITDRFDYSDRLRLEGGVRLEHAETPNLWFPSPRLAVHQKLTERDELTVGLGLYAQTDLPFEALDQNPNLKPEKAWNFSTGLTHTFGDRIQFQIEYWYKWYEDLVVAQTSPNAKIDWKIGPMDSLAFEKIPRSQQDLIRQIYGDKNLGYSNEGLGEAQGLEMSVSYRPNSIWTGWFSGEQSVSRRQDHRTESWVPYRYHRPWALNWVNWWHMPSNYALGTRLRYAAGQAYTPYSDQVNDPVSFSTGTESDGVSDTLLWIGKRNSARYAPYLRFDLRISHDTKLWNHPCQTYFEIWNAWNDPNFIMRDQETGKFKFTELNYPIPVLFFGMRWSY